MIFPTSFWPVDSLSFFMLIMVTMLFSLVFVYSLAYVKRNLFRYYFVLLMALLGILGTILAKDLLSFYICLELMTVAVYFLIVDNTKKESFPAGFKYVIMMFAGGLFILVAALMLYNLTGTFEFAVFARVAHTLPAESIKLILALFVIGCLIEIGAVPFHVWLPDAHPIAPSPVSALLSGLVIKIGAYGLIRMLFIFKLGMQLLIWVGVLSMIFGVVLAIRQTNIKRLLAYSSISQMGYVLLGMGIGTSLGIGGGLFLCLGAVIYATRERELKNLGGLGKRMPITAATFCIGALAISGIPPFNGFASKALIVSATAGNLWLKTALIITAAGTTAVFLKLFLQVFWGELPAQLKKTNEVPAPMCFSLLILAGICLVVGLFPGPVLNKFVPLTGIALLHFEFWNFKLLVDTTMAVFLGLAIYFFGVRFGLLGVGEGRGKENSTLLSYLSVDKFYCGVAALIEALCNMLKKVMRRSLNVYLLWIFMALVILLFVLWCPLWKITI